MLDGTHAPNAHPSACGAASMQTPSKARMHINAERNPLVLPREVGDAPRALDQVPGQPDQRGPIRGGRVRHPPPELLS
eukprot:8057696-Alexandrium_andersonii.AAC.1